MNGLEMVEMLGRDLTSVGVVKDIEIPKRQKRESDSSKEIDKDSSRDSGSDGVDRPTGASKDNSRDSSKDKINSSKDGSEALRDENGARDAASGPRDS